MFLRGGSQYKPAKTIFAFSFWESQLEIRVFGTKKKARILARLRMPVVLPTFALTMHLDAASIRTCQPTEPRPPAELSSENAGRVVGVAPHSTRLTILYAPFSRLSTEKEKRALCHLSYRPSVSGRTGLGLNQRLSFSLTLLWSYRGLGVAPADFRSSLRVRHTEPGIFRALRIRRSVS
jgi:hypothetical protein